MVFYRPPSGSPQEFLNELLQYIDGHSTTIGHLLLVGDLNFHFESQTDPNAAKLKDLLYSLNLKQSVEEPTHERGHTLDLVITHQEELDVYDLTATPNTLLPPWQRRLCFWERWLVCLSCLSVCLSVCLFVCGQHYSKSYERIGMKFYGRVLSSTSKN